MVALCWWKVASFFQSKQYEPKGRLGTWRFV
jgi:hypothetical protein